MNPTPLKVIIVDDETLARENIEALLQGDPEITVLAQCANGQKAVDAVQKFRPDILFLDVQMPGWDGFDVLARLGNDAPHVIFVTAYDQYAIKAFEVNALDYLLKPFSRRRFGEAMTRAKAQRRGGDAALLARFDSLLHTLKATVGTPASAPSPSSVAGPEAPAGDSWQGRLLFRADGEIHVLAPSEIRWIQSNGDYLKVHAADKTRLVRMAMVKVLQKLDSRRFVRIHRSCVVNLDHVRKVKPALFGEYMVELHDGTKLKVSRTFVPELKAYM